MIQSASVCCQSTAQIDSPLWHCLGIIFYGTLYFLTADLGHNFMIVFFTADFAYHCQSLPWHPHHCIEAFSILFQRMYWNHLFASYIFWYCLISLTVFLWGFILFSIEFFIHSVALYPSFRFRAPQPTPQPIVHRSPSPPAQGQSPTATRGNPPTSQIWPQHLKPRWALPIAMGSW